MVDSKRKEMKRNENERRLKKRKGYINIYGRIELYEMKSTYTNRREVHSCVFVWWFVFLNTQYHSAYSISQRRTILEILIIVFPNKIITYIDVVDIGILSVQVTL